MTNTSTLSENERTLDAHILEQLAIIKDLQAKTPSPRVANRIWFSHKAIEHIDNCIQCLELKRKLLIGLISLEELADKIT